MGDAGAAVIANTILKAPNARIQSLDVSQTQLGVDGAVTLLGTAPASLKTLVLGAVPLVKEDDSARLVAAIKGALEKRKQLTLTLVKPNAKGPGPVEDARIKWLAPSA